MKKQQQNQNKPPQSSQANQQSPNKLNPQGQEQEDFAHLDNDPDVDKAAQRIQANFRGKQDRKKVEEMKKEQDKAKQQQQPLQQSPKQPQRAPVPNQTKEESDAALRIQSQYRGNRDRQRVQDLKKEQEKTKAQQQKPTESPQPNNANSPSNQKPNTQKPEEENFAHLDNDPDVDKAAQKIQANFRGKQDRKKVEEMKKEQEKVKAENPKPQGSPAGKQDNKVPSNKPEFSPVDKRNQDAAIKIQSRYRGNRDRERIQEMKKNRAGFAPKTYEEMFGHTTKTQEQDAKRIQENYNKVKDPSKVDLVHPDQHKEHSNKDNQKAQEVEEPPLDDPLMDMITGKIKIAINQVFINKEVELQPHYSLAILVKAGERSKFSLIRIQIELR
jgi:hypothetical protein